jgi:hypothetical protein
MSLPQVCHQVFEDKKILALKKTELIKYQYDDIIGELVDALKKYFQYK